MLKLLLFFKKYLIGFVKAQAIVTLVSFPILIMWGIPLSLMTFVGNFLFAPILTIFLMISSLIFITELLHIPNTLLITSLDKLTVFWEYLLSFGKKCWLVGFAQPNKTVLILLGIFVFFIVVRFIFSILSRLLLIAVIVFAAWAGLEYVRQTRPPKYACIKAVPGCAEKLLVKETKDNTIEVIDNGLFTKKRSPEKFINFELKPYLIKNYGTTKINKIVLHDPSARSFRAVQELSNTFTIKTVSIAYFANPLTKYGWRCFFWLKDKLSKEAVKIKRFKKVDRQIAHR